MDYFSPNNPNSKGSSSVTIVAKGKRKGGNRSRGGVKLSTDPQSVAARERRHRISDRFKILQSLVPGGTKMDTVSMLDEAIHYVKYLKAQIWLHQNIMNYVEEDPPILLQGSVPFQDGFYTSNNITNFTAPLQPSMVQPSPPLALQEFNCFQGEGTMYYLNDYVKYYL